MIIVRLLILSIIIFSYATIFNVHDKKIQGKKLVLTSVLPSDVYRVTAGYLTQFFSELLFVKTGVYLGGSDSVSHQKYQTILGDHFHVMTTLYPRFIDPYYFSQSFLTPISVEAAKRSNDIFELGIKTFPNDLILRFFYGTNFFMSLNEPLKAANVFNEAAKLSNAPVFFGRLASLLSAKGGDLTAGLMSLKKMIASENNALVKFRYSQEIEQFKKAIQVQGSIDAYIKKYGTTPDSLSRLVPEFMSEIPSDNQWYTFVYDPPTIKLERPQAKINKGIPWK